MKLGTENRTATIVAIVLFAVAILLLVRMWSGSGQPASAAPPTAVVPAQPTPPPRAAARARRVTGPRREPVAQPAGNAISLDPRLRLDLLKQSEDTEYKGAGRNIFRAEADIPKPIENPVKTADIPQPPLPPPGPPPPPPINLKFFGFASSPGEPTKVFLGNGDDVFVAGEGEIVNRRYKVMKINPKSVEIEDVLGNNRQTIPLTAG
jgi:hypothetical protein